MTQIRASCYDSLSRQISLAVTFSGKRNRDAFGLPRWVRRPGVWAPWPSRAWTRRTKTFAQKAAGCCSGAPPHNPSSQPLRGPQGHSVLPTALSEAREMDREHDISGKVMQAGSKARGNMGIAFSNHPPNLLRARFNCFRQSLLPAPSMSSITSQTRRIVRLKGHTIVF